MEIALSIMLIALLGWMVWAERKEKKCQTKKRMSELYRMLCPAMSS